MYVQPAVCDYDPVHFIRCHFGDKKAIKKGHTDNDPTDNVTNVWCCAMEPDPDDLGLYNDYILSSYTQLSCQLPCFRNMFNASYNTVQELQLHCLQQRHLAPC